MSNKKVVVRLKTYTNSSVIRENGKFQNGCLKKQSTPSFPKQECFLLSDTHTFVRISGGKKCSFLRKLDVLCFLETSVLRFTLLPYYQRIYCAIKSLNESDILENQLRWEYLKLEIRSLLTLKFSKTYTKKLKQE